MRSNTAKLLIAGLLAVLLPVLFSSPPALADSDQALARKLLAAGSILELETIVAKAQAIRPGELLEAEFDHDDGRYVYEVEILDAMGQVWELKLDAATGRLLKQERDD